METNTSEHAAGTSEEPADDIRLIVGSRLRAIRESRKLSGADLARACGVSRQAVHCWEHGITIPTIENLRSASKVLKLKLPSLCVRLFEGM